LAFRYDVVFADGKINHGGNLRKIPRYDASKTHASNMNPKLPSLLIACFVFLAGCSAIEWSTATSAVTASAPAILDALKANGVKIGQKTSADIQAAGWALQLLANRQTGTKITAGDLTTGIDQVDNVLSKYVKQGTLTASGVSILSDVAKSLIGK